MTSRALPETPTPSLAVDDVRDAVRRLPASRIREVANLGMGDGSVIPLWFGESDTPTPAFICDSAARALAAGDTFYQLNSGIPELRDAIAAYMNGLYGTRFARDRITVTVSGMNALMLALQAVAGRGDVVVTTEPIWPNLPAVGHVLEADVRTVDLEPHADGWRLDLERFLDACKDATAILLNSPNNPSGWMMEEDDQRALLDFARRRGIWIVADEVYARVVYDRPVAPSFAPLVDDEDRVIIVNSFSKSWAMTGWRLGWIAAPPSLSLIFEKLMEFNVACPPGFVQRAGLTAITEGEAFVARQVRDFARGRDLVLERLDALPRVALPRPAAAFYAFFAVDGVSDGVAFAQDLLRDTGVGLAPGEAFGQVGAGYLRLCFATSVERLGEALDRMQPALR